MERMMYNEISDEVLNGFKEADNIVKNRIAQLEEENKKLRDGNSLAFDDIERICNEKLQLEEENKKLRSELSKYNEMEEHIEDGLLTPIPNVWSHEEEIRRLKIKNKKLKEILNRIKELYEDEEEVELLNYLDEILDEI